MSAAVRALGDKERNLVAEVAAGRAPALAAAERPPAPMAPEARFGFVGNYIDTIGPYSESDPNADIAHLLVGFGNAVGRSPYIGVGPEQHRANENLLIVGNSSTARKGTSWSWARRVLTSADPNWRTTQGLVSGEGLIYHVRDERYEKKKSRKDEIDRADADGYVMELVDEGVADKRLAPVETEFATVLKAMGRDSNTLSPVLRQAWDGLDLSTLAKNSPTKATAPHISVIAHITTAELKSLLSDVDAASGFGNRFAFCYATRSKSLPEGDMPPEADMRLLTSDLRSALEAARATGEVRRTPAARELWAEVYPTLTAGNEGLYGALTARAAPHVLRFSLIYALLAGENTVREEDLRGALAVWDYFAGTAGYLFGNESGDPLAEKIHRFLIQAGRNGRTRDAIGSDLLQRHRTKDEIDRALEALADAGRAFVKTDKQTGGRPAEIWRASHFSVDRLERVNGHKPLADPQAELVPSAEHNGLGLSSYDDDPGGSL